jgi:hypothetical protein
MKNLICTLFSISVGLFLTGCHTHTFSPATCTEPMICNECGQTQGAPLGHTVVIDSLAKDATCTEDGVTESSHCSVCGVILSNAIVIPAKGHDIVTEPAKESTCTDAGCTEATYCKNCSKHFSESETLPALGHELDDKGYCKRCGKADTSSEAYKLGRIQEKAEKLAISCAEEYLKSLYPSYFVILSEKAERMDEYLRYKVTIEYKAENTITHGEINNISEVNIRISSKCDGTYYKNDKDYGKKPKDWNLDAIIDIQSAPAVYIEKILSNYSLYNGQYVKIDSDLVLAHNNIERKSFTCYKSTGSKKYEYDTDKKIEIFYSLCDNTDYLLSLTADYQKISLVGGYVKVYNNDKKAYLDANEIVIRKAD